MFKSKSKTEKARAEAGKKLGKARHQAQQQAVKQTGKATKQAGKAATHVVHVADSANTAFRERVAPVAVGAALTAREKAMHGIDHGVDAAAPRVEHAVAAVGPRVDHARDLIVDDLLPRIQDMLNGVVDAKDDALSRRGGAVAVVTGSPKKKKRKGGVLIVFGVLAAAGAGVAAYLNKQQTQDDPWARPEPVDRPVGAAGVDAEVGAAAATGSSATAATGATAAGATAAGGGAEGQPTATGQTSDVPTAVDDADDASALPDGHLNDVGSTNLDDSDDLVQGSGTDDTTGFGNTSRP